MSGFTSLGKKAKAVTVVSPVTGTNSNAVGPFGTTLVSNLTPAAQAGFVYGTTVNSILWTTSSNGTGSSVGVSEGVMSCASGNSLSGSSTVRMNRYIKYRAGQGVVCRLTSIFSDGSDDTKQLAGVGNSESGYFFGRVGTNFGILHRETSKREIRSFTVSAQNTVTVTVQLDGDSKSFAVAGGSSANQTAFLISQADYSQVGKGWTAEAYGSTIYFISDRPGPFGGTFDIKVGGVTIVTGSSTLQAGVLPTDTFISQSSWNIDRMDGTGPSGVSIDPSKGNIYGVGYQYLGFGDPVFSMENPETGFLVDVHRIKAANARTSVVVRNPQMTARWEAINSGSAATNVTVKGASAALFTEGVVSRSVGVALSTSATKASVSSTIVPVLTLRVNKVYNNQCSYGEMEIFNISLGCDAGSSANNKILKVFAYKNAVLGGPVNFQAVDSARSFVSADTSATTVTTGSNTQLLRGVLIAANDSVTLKLDDENFFLTSGDTLTVAAQRGGSSDVDNALVSVGWFEDQ